MRHQPNVIIFVLPSGVGIFQAVKFYQKHPESSVLQLAIVAVIVPIIFWGIVVLLAECTEWMMTLRKGNHVFVTAGEYAGKTGQVFSKPTGAECVVKVRLDGSEPNEIEIFPILLRKKGLLSYLF